MVARLRDLPQAVFDALLIIDVRTGDGCHADDRIHRRADIMRHVGQEFGLGLIRTVRCLTGITQCIMGADLRKLLFCGVLRDQKYFLGPAVFPLDGGAGQGLISLRILFSVLEAENALRLRKPFPEIGGRDHVLKGALALLQGAVVFSHGTHKVVIRPLWRIVRLGLHAVEIIGILCQIADRVAVYELQCPLQQEVDLVLLVHELLDALRLFLDLRDVADEDKQSRRAIVTLIINERISHPADVFSDTDAAVEAKFSISQTDLAQQILTAVQQCHGRPVLLTDKTVDVDLHQLFPAAARFPFREEGVILLERGECAFIEIHVVFGKIRCRERAMEGIAAPLLLLKPLFFVDIEENARHAPGRPILTADRFCIVSEPVIHARGILHTVVHFKAGHASPCDILYIAEDPRRIRRMHKVCPRLPCIREI